jgi:hypothetical protein
MGEEKTKLINKFYGGIVRDEKSTVTGSASNIEEIDIFTNKDYFQAEQIFSADALPASTEVYAYTSGSDDTVYGYGKETANSKIRIVSVASGGGSNPGAFATLFTGSDSTNLATPLSPVEFFKTTEVSNNTSLYFIKGTSTSWYISRYNLGAAAEQRWTGTAWSGSGSWDSNSQLTGLNGTFMRPTMRIIYGELYICNGNLIAKVDEDGTFDNAAFTLPNDWEAVDIVAVGSSAIILARNISRTVNYTKGYWWDLTTDEQFDDSFTIPMGGPQWIYNHREMLKIFCSLNGKARIYQMQPYAGAMPVELPGISIDNTGTETSTQPVSPSKMVHAKENVLYFGLFKTDKSGLYALGRLDSDKPEAYILSKRFHTTSYATHSPTGGLIQGANFYAAFSDNGTASTARCETLNSPDRSSNAVYETIVVDDGNPLNDKAIKSIQITTQPLVASTDVDVHVASEYGSYSQVYRADGTSLNTTSATTGEFKPKLGNAKTWKVKLALTSSGTSSPKVTAIGMTIVSLSKSARK